MSESHLIEHKESWCDFRYICANDFEEIEEDEEYS